MAPIDAFKNIDIYLIDQILKGAIDSTDTILDAGCGSGRNLSFFVQNGYTITGFDPKVEHIDALKEKFPTHAAQFHVNTIENFTPPHPYQYIICSAVLHFASDHDHFNRMFAKLAQMLSSGGKLFVRMTTSMGMNELPASENGVHLLPDASTRYLIHRDQLDELCAEHRLMLAETPKTVLVDHLRSMGVFVFQKA